jgi:hypothetical protein
MAGGGKNDDSSQIILFNYLSCAPELSTMKVTYKFINLSCCKGKIQNNDRIIICMFNIYDDVADL